VAQLYPRALSSLLVASYDSQGYGGDMERQICVKLKPVQGWDAKCGRLEKVGKAGLRFPIGYAVFPQLPRPILLCVGQRGYVDSALRIYLYPSVRVCSVMLLHGGYYHWSVDIPVYILCGNRKTTRRHIRDLRPPLWSSGQSSWLLIRRPGFDSRHYQKKAVGLERGPLSLVSTTEELLGRKSSGSGLENRKYGRRDPSR
jgi:hypothetical protein